MISKSVSFGFPTAQSIRRHVRRPRVARVRLPTLGSPRSQLKQSVKASEVEICHLVVIGYLFVDYYMLGGLT